MIELEKYYQVLMAIICALFILHFYYKYVDKDRVFGKYLISFGLGILFSLLLALSLL
ncbi:hypothetical protein [Vagococcus sp.]|uniref:Immunity protein n=1 Tax=Carnobacterium maltaromaticum TaxID=2751 RepID=A0AAW9K7U7_CARML|nr:hypothetical protein [Carnobacterium maltaromaticum]